LINGIDKALTGLRAQDCDVLRRARGFAAQTSVNKVIRKTCVACQRDDIRRWIIVAWEPCDRPWANPNTV
jgi:hypothetical protein